MAIGVIMLTLGAVAQAVAPQQPAPEIGLPDLAGTPVRLSALRGRVVLVDFWATWCTPCRASLPHYVALKRRLASRGFELVAITVDEQRENVDAFVRTHGLEVLRVVHDAKGQVAGRYQPAKMPTAYLLDTKGVVQHVYEGFQPGDEAAIARDVEALLPRH